MGLLDFPADWNPLTLALVGLLACAVILVASFGTAIAWRRYKEGKRKRQAGAAHAAAPPKPAAPTGVRFATRAKLTKFPKPSLKRK